MRQDLHYKETLFFIQQSSILHYKVGLCVCNNIILPIIHYSSSITHNYQELFPAIHCIFFVTASALLHLQQKRMPFLSGLGIR